MDTSLQLFSQYRPFFNYPSQNLGNFGSDFKHLALSSYSKPGFTTRVPYDFYYNKLDDSGYYSTISPYTRVRYSNATKEEQIIDFVHTQNILPNWNVAVSYGSMSSTGFYFRQRTEHKVAKLSSFYQSLNKAYLLKIQAILNTSEIEENGGIDGDSLFLENLQPNRQGIPVALSNAKNNADNRGFEIDQYFRVIKSGKSDTTENIKKKRRFQLFLNHRSKFEWKYNRFDDSGQDTTFYINNGLDSNTLGIREIREIREWNNYLGLTIESFGTLNAGIRLQSIDYKDGIYQEDFQTLLGEGDYSLLLLNKYTARFKGEYGFSGIGEGNYSLDAKVNIPFASNFLNITGLFNTSRVLPHTIYWLYGNEEFGWNYTPEDIFTNQLGLEIQSDSLDLVVKVNGYTYQNLAYFENPITPDQWNGTITAFQASIEKTFHLRALHFRLNAYYQTLSEELGPIRVPTFWTYSGLYYEQDLFKKALRLRLGADVMYMTAFKSVGYLPVNRTFYLQDDTEIGNYPFVDVYLAAQIKKVRVLAKLTHLNQSFSGYNYLNFPGYPHFDRQLRLGVNWTFLN